MSKSRETERRPKSSDLYAFNEHEQWLRDLYYNHGGTFLAQPMTYTEYEQLMEEHPDYLDLREFFEILW